jgi:Mg2+-importing ATPase
MEEFIKSPWQLTEAAIMHKLNGSPEGLSVREAAARARRQKTQTPRASSEVPAWYILARQFASPLILILLVAVGIAAFLGQRLEAIIILVMLSLNAIMAFVQEYRSERAFRALREQLARTAVVLRDSLPVRLPVSALVLGDVIVLTPGTVIPADLRLFKADELEIDESALTGESVPVLKTTQHLGAETPLPGRKNMAFLGTAVIAGTGLGIVTSIGTTTELEKIGALLTKRRGETDFQRGIKDVGRVLLGSTLALAAVVFLSLGVLRGHWTESLIFALAIAIGVSPELLPVIVTMNLSRGAIALGKKFVLVKRLEAIENFGNADVFCMDKTGTLTEGVIRVRGALNAALKPAPEVLRLAALCTEVGPAGSATNPIDASIMAAGAQHPEPYIRHATFSFDYTRRRMSVILGCAENKDRLLITKGAAKEVLSCCRMSEERREELITISEHYQSQGSRTIAVARRHVPIAQHYHFELESDLEFIGFVLLSDIPKPSAKEALFDLAALHTRIIVLTGDTERISRRVASEIGFKVSGVIRGVQLERMSDAELKRVVEKTNVFAEILPGHKLRIVETLRRNGHTVGFLGDGVNDAPALRAADVGISFETATDVAREAADVILTKRDLEVLADGIREGRRTFANMHTYFNATLSSNFGNMMSVAAAALFIPFIPMLPAQILLLNTLDDLPMLAIPSDNVPDDALLRPRKWSAGYLMRFILFFGVISSLADFGTFIVLFRLFGERMAVFRSGWFIESLLTEILVVFLLRSERFRKNPPSITLITTCLVSLGAAFLIVDQLPFGRTLGFVPITLPLLAAILSIVITYAAAVLLGKRWFFKMFGTFPVRKQN